MCDDTILTICFMTRGDLAMPYAPSVLLNFHRQQKHLISTTGALVSSSHNSLRGIHSTALRNFAQEPQTPYSLFPWCSNHMTIYI